MSTAVSEGEIQATYVEADIDEHEPCVSPVAGVNNIEARAKQLFVGYNVRRV
jgi:hypothetical protein